MRKALFFCIFYLLRGNNHHGDPMKRFCVTAMLVAVISAVLIYSMPKDFCRYASKVAPYGTACIYCLQTDMPAINSGNGYIVQCNVSNIGTALAHCKGIDGVSVSFAGTMADAIDIAKMFRLYDEARYELGEIAVVCGKSDMIKGFVTADGRQINLQIAFVNGIVTVGSPLILGSY